MNTKSLLLALFLATLFITTSCEDKVKKQYDTTINKANKLFLEKNYKEALLSYEEAVKLMPSDAATKDEIVKIKALILAQDENKFQMLISEAAGLVEEENYEAAKELYQEAATIKPNDDRIVNEISNIDTLLAEAKEPEPVYDSSNPYHIIVGSFQNEFYATRLQDKLKAEGYDSKLITRPNGFTGVSFSSHPNIHDAYNNLSKGREYHNDVWVVKSEF